MTETIETVRTFLRETTNAAVTRTPKGGLRITTNELSTSLDVRYPLVEKGVPFHDTLKNGRVVYTIPPATEWWRYTYNKTHMKWV